MQYEISNSRLAIVINDHGAELRSIRNTRGHEFLWQADPTYWKRSSPVLFPVVGQFREGSFEWKGRTYKMGQHGFARDSDFTLISKDDSKIKFSLKSSEKTHELYPFDFELIISYELTDSTIKVSWEVVNTDRETIYFSIGAHPAFYCPYDQTDSTAKISFDNKNDLHYQLINEHGLCKDDVYSLKTDDGIWTFDNSVFDNDALIFPDCQANEIALLKADGTPYLKVKFRTPVFGIWSPVKKNAPFVCIEPWYGRCDSAVRALPLDRREYGNSLAVGATFKADYEITILE